MEVTKAVGMATTTLDKKVPLLHSEKRLIAPQSAALEDDVLVLIALGRWTAPSGYCEHVYDGCQRVREKVQLDKPRTEQGYWSNLNCGIRLCVWTRLSCKERGPV